MATRTYSLANQRRGVWTFRWTGLLNGDDGSPATVPQFSDKSVQVYGTFGAGGTLILEGANEPTSPTYATLNDPQGNALSVTTAKIEQVLENTLIIRPRVSAGDATTDLTVVVCAATPSTDTSVVT